MKREFYDKPPNLSGDEEIIAHAGEGEDQWANAQSAGGLFSAMNDRCYFVIQYPDKSGCWCSGFDPCIARSFIKPEKEKK